MAAQIIDGFSIAQNVRAGVGEKVKELQLQIYQRIQYFM